MRAPKIASVAVIIAAIALLVAAIAGALGMLEKYKAFHQRERDSTFWAVGQVEVEILRLKAVLLEKAPVDEVDVETRIDILWSRLKILEVGRTGVEITGLEGAKPAVAGLRAALELIDSRLDDVIAREPSAVEAVLPALDSAHLPIRTLALEALHWETGNKKSFLEQFEGAIELVFVTYGAILLAAFCAIVVLIRQKRAILSAREDAEDATKRFQEFAVTASDWFWEADAQHRYIFFSRMFEGAFAKFIGVHRRDAALIETHEEEASWAGHMAEIEAHKPFRDFTYRIKNATGRIQFVRSSGLPIFGPAGEFQGYRGTSTDVTSEVELSINAEKAQSALREGIETLREGFALYDAEDRLVICNETYREMYPKSRDVMIPGTPFEDILRAGIDAGEYEAAKADPEAWLKIRLERHRNPPSVPMEQELSDGRTLLVAEQKMLDGGVVGVRVDITQRKKAEAAAHEAQRQAESANRVKSEFLAVMSHELRTPLNGVVGMIDLAYDQTEDGTVRSHLDSARRSSEHLLTLIGDILDVSKMESGRFELEAIPFSPQTLVEETEAILRPRADAKGLRFEMVVDSSVPEVLKGDVGRLRQILINLAGNAIKFTEAGEVFVSLHGSATAEGDFLLCGKVRDTGIGIDLEKKDDLFKEFTQLDSSYRRNFGGTGLGLSITKRLVETMGGDVEVFSSPGKGATFTFSAVMGLAPADQIVPKTEDHKDALPRLDGLRILLVDDSQSNRLVAKLMLQKAGCRVSTGSDGLEALEILKGTDIDIVLMDIAMPQMDGLEATRRARSLGFQQPFIALTANALATDREASIEAGMDGFLTKPLRIHTLIKGIHQVLNGRGDVAETKPAVAPEGDDALDLEVISSLRDEAGAEILPDLIHEFLQEMEQRKAALNTPERWTNLGGLAIEAHALKGCAAAYGAKPLSLIAADMEKALRAGNTDQAKFLLGDLDEACQKSRAAYGRVLEDDAAVDPVSQAI